MELLYLVVKSQHACILLTQQKNLLPIYILADLYGKGDI